MLQTISIAASTAFPCHRLSPYIFDLLQTSVVARRLARCFAGWRLRHSLCLLRAVKLESQL
ncbi:hypothetical protein QZM39_19350, partial [Burkholderia cenocepacia]|uniref:hypothetical protein n=1 Tax=Burkholderia cenocepacia TaxID=95486 RepID=UPI0026554C9D